MTFIPMDRVWIVTYGHYFLPNEENMYSEKFDLFEQNVEEELRKICPDVYFVDHYRDGGEVQITFGTSTPKNLPRVIPANFMDIEFERIDFKPETEWDQPDLHKPLFQYYMENKDYILPFMELSIKIMSQAINSFENKAYEGTVVLCRSVIDSSLYLACVYKRYSDSEGNILLSFKPPDSFKKKNETLINVHWDTLKEKSKELFSLDLDKFVCEIREMGNFSAHLGERQLREYSKWVRENDAKFDEIKGKVIQNEEADFSSYHLDYKVWTTVWDAEFAIINTIDFLGELVKAYNKTYP